LLVAITFDARIETRAEQHAGCPQHHHRREPAAVGNPAGGYHGNAAGREIDDRRHDIDGGARGAVASVCTWQIRSAPAALMRGAKGAGSPNDSMIARGPAASAMSSSTGCFAMLQVMKPMPNGAGHLFSLAVSCSSHALSP